MKMSGQTILITGGTSGIGLELATQLIKNNTVIITGRDQRKLDSTKRSLPHVHIIQSDVADPHAIQALYTSVTDQFPALNVLINNAGIMRKINLQDSSMDLLDLTREIEINLVGPIRMTKQFLPHLKSKVQSAIINVSSGLAFVPFPISPVYSASKSGIHAYTECLRIQLKNTNVRVFELAPPGTETPLFRGDFTEKDLAGTKGMDVQTLVKKALAGIQNDRSEIRPGLSNVLKILSRVAPGFILKQLGKPVEHMLLKSN